LAEASSLVSSDLRKSKFYPVKSDLRISGLVLPVLLVLWYWFSGTFVKLGFSGTFVKLACQQV
jgi:hypothetical protein